MTAIEPTSVALHARDVQFDWSKTPVHWVPDEPELAHFYNVMHLLLPELELWFVQVFTDALPYITDAKVREDVLGFIGQENMHANAHQGALDLLAANGIDPEPYTSQVHHLLQGWIDRTRKMKPKRRKQSLLNQIAVIAAGEHFTAVLGDFALNSPAFDEVGTDPVMSDLLRWHGAEEVEHRSVAFDLFRHLDGRYPMQVVSMLAVIPALWMLWHRGARMLLEADPTLTPKQRKLTLRKFRRWHRRGLLPNAKIYLPQLTHYLKGDYHPSHYGSTTQAIAYLATSPAAKAGQQ
ncbi:metal-dependent hydrolase [Pseudonocardiaceae bacterium YIM PH 21723]|nr:metal-dependent hydrolase [Pseudonocardiaceae bacterium YIM PH 21723]